VAAIRAGVAAFLRYGTKLLMQSAVQREKVPSSILAEAQDFDPRLRQGRQGDRRAGTRAYLMLSAMRLFHCTSRLGAPYEGDNVQRKTFKRVLISSRLPRDDDQFRDTLEWLPFAVLVTDQNGEIVFANAGAQMLFGYRREELTGGFLDTLIPGLREGVDAVRQSVASPGHAIRAVGGTRDVFARRKEGTEFPAEITTNPVAVNDAAFKVTVVIDRSERYELQRNRQELAHLTRISTLGELAGSLAHELNQPLTAILSNAQAAQRFMAMEPVNLAEVREILQDLVDDDRRASEVIRRIRALVKKGGLEAAPLSLAEVIGEVVLLLHSDAIVRRVRVLSKVDPALPTVHGDRVQLQQVTLNLLLNAFDAMESLAVSDGEVEVEASLEGECSVRVAVRDRGPGLPEDNIEKLFLPFVTSKRDGLGLGLSISRSIVGMHGGRIWAENNVDRGATFYFTLPTAGAFGTASLRGRR
jgi:two-component system sensor kinase FixL